METLKIAYINFKNRIMKTKLSVGAILFALMLMVANVGFAQKQEGRMGKKGGQAFGFIQDLTPEQQTKLDALQVDQKKNMIGHKTKIDLEQAKLKSLQVAEKPDMKAINSSIDLISVERTAMQKERAAHHQAVRAILTDAQRLDFDAHFVAGKAGKKGSNKNCCKGDGPKKGDCKGDGPKKGDCKAGPKGEQPKP
jgi:Spy/CpxP family protein refolding chaperone